MLTADELEIFKGKLLTRMLELAKEQAEAELKDNTKCADEAKCKFRFLSLYRSVIFSENQNYTNEELADIVDYVTFIGQLNEVIPISFTQLTNIIIEVGTGGGVSSHTALTNVSILTKDTVPESNIAYHIGKDIAKELQNIIYGTPEPELPEGVFFETPPGTPTLEGNQITETDSVVSDAGILYNVLSETVAFAYSQAGYRRYDAIVINLQYHSYDLIGGVEEPITEVAAFPFIPEGYMLVRYIEVRDNIILPPTNYVKGITVNGNPTVYIPNTDGIVDVEVEVGASAWDDITGKPVTFPPSSHTHTVANITDWTSATSSFLTSSGAETSIDYTPADSDNTNGIFKTLLTAGKLKLKPALDRIVTILQLANTMQLTFKCNSDVGTTSDSIAIKGVVADVTEDRTAEDGTVPISGTFTYSYRLSTTGTWTTGQTLAQLRTQLLTANSSTITWVRATNIVTLGVSTSILTIKRY